MRGRRRSCDEVREVCTGPPRACHPRARLRRLVLRCVVTMGRDRREQPNGRRHLSASGQSRAERVSGERFARPLAPTSLISWRTSATLFNAAGSGRAPLSAALLNENRSKAA